MQKRKQHFLTAILILLILVVIGCIVYVGSSLYKQNKARQEYEQLKQEAKDQKKEPVKEPPKEPEPVDTPEPVEIPIDFEALWQENEEIYAWIEIPGTSINYPVLQREDDDEYYLNHNLDGSTGRPAVIFSQHFNKKDFGDFNTILYGHNMRNGTMFADLHKYEDPEFMEENHQVLIYTPEHIYTYEIFAAVSYSDKHIMYSYDFSTEKGKQEFLDSIYQSRDLANIYRENVAVDTKDRILTLSTCIYGVNDRRFLVEAVLTDEQ